MTCTLDKDLFWEYQVVGPRQLESLSEIIRLSLADSVTELGVEAVGEGYPHHRFVDCSEMLLVGLELDEEQTRPFEVNAAPKVVSSQCPLGEIDMGAPE